MTIWVLNGPNLDLLGEREPEIYGKETYAELVARVTAACKARGIRVKVKQTNHEGTYVDWIHAAKRRGADGLILNPAAYTHTSVAIADAVRAVCLPAVEVHLSAIETREPFRQISYVRDACVATVTGKGIDGYLDAIGILAERKK